MPRSRPPEWQKVVEQFRASGLTQREFAERRRLKLSRLQSWLYRPSRGQASEPARFVPVVVRPGFDAGATPAAIEFRAPFGWALRFPQGADVQYVARLVAAIAEQRR